MLSPRRSVPPGRTAVGLGAQQLGAGRGPGAVRDGPGQAAELHRRTGRGGRPGTGRGLPARGAARPADGGRRDAAHVPERVRAERGRRGGPEQLPGGRGRRSVARVRRVRGRLDRGVRRPQVPAVRVRRRRQPVRPAVRRGHQRGALAVQLQRHTGKRVAGRSHLYAWETADRQQINPPPQGRLVGHCVFIDDV